MMVTGTGHFSLVFNPTIAPSAPMPKRPMVAASAMSRLALSSTVPGKVYQGPAEDTTNQNPSGGLAVTAQAVGDTQVTLTGSLTLAANLLAGGYLSVNVTPGLGQLYRIKGNTAVSSAANVLCT